MINYFNFKKINNNQFILTNDFGNYVFLSPKEFYEFMTNKIDQSSELYTTLEDRHFIVPRNKKEILQNTQEEYRLSKNYLFNATSLHIFVVTNECNLRCVYCQARNETTHKNGFMTNEIAEKAVDIALSAPDKNLNFEFQGGEPLLNFPVIKHIVQYAEMKKGYHTIHYSVVTNLTLMTEEIIDFLGKYNINISTSIDGGEFVHNCNRPFINGKGSFEAVSKKLKAIRPQISSIGAIQTTTRNSLSRYKEIIDAYISLGFDNIFIRPLTPLGTASKAWDTIGYSPEEFLDFYKNSLDYIIELNKKGILFREGHASMFLSKIVHKQPLNYMELRSPCGASIGQIAYYFNGDVFTCDEGRMLSEMGDDSFKLGNVNSSTYDSLMSSNTCKTVCLSSLLESLPGCTDCVYQPFCGTCPVVNYATEKNIFRRDVYNYRCKIYGGMLDIIFRMLSSDDEAKSILSCW